MTDPTSRQRGHPQNYKTVTLKKKSLVKCPRFGLDTKTYWLTTDRQLQCDFYFDFDFDFALPCSLRGPGPPGWRSLRGDSRIWSEFCGTRTREWLFCKSPEPTVRVNYRSTLSSERAPHIKKRARCRPTGNTTVLLMCVTMEAHQNIIGSVHHSHSCFITFQLKFS
jgi:hypothetical protein